MKQYDADGDGFIAGSELDAAVSLKAAMATLDVDKDGKVSEGEIAERIRSWQVNKIGLTGVTCKVTLDGKALSGLKVDFIPEEFLGGNLIAAEGETSPIGMAIVSILKEKRPDPTWPTGVQYGFYRVQVSGPGVPARYSSQAVLGQQVAPDDPAILSQNMQFKLTSK
ncbi:MAG: EF-hand domain-containing protein [Pirellulales bacterium]|nr:EF-hand domain-containing protein [Pirellulales bacterium]